MMFLSKEATDKDQSLKMQVMLSLDKDDSSNSEKIWKKKTSFETKMLILQQNDQSWKIPWFIVIKVQFRL